jgi:hypothetical protein
MNANNYSGRRKWVAGGLLTFLGVLLVAATTLQTTQASFLDRLLPWGHGCGHHGYCDGGHPPCDLELTGEPGGVWYWHRSPDEEKRVIMGLYNRYCIRCHGVDGHGIWDIPDVPNFANGVWQASRSDTQLARAILEGRGAVMPPFRGTLTLEEACAMARYLRTFIPGSEASQPDYGQPEKSTPAEKDKMLPK